MGCQNLLETKIFIVFWVEISKNNTKLFLPKVSKQARKFFEIVTFNEDLLLELAQKEISNNCLFKNCYPPTHFSIGIIKKETFIYQDDLWQLSNKELTNLFSLTKIKHGKINN